MATTHTYRSWRFPFLAAFISLLPLIWSHADFAQLFYFEDELDLIDLRDRLGFASWTGHMFAENFVPLFKLTWGGAVAIFNGSYFSLVALLWLNHALNSALLARLLQKAGLTLRATALATLVFGLVSTNLETLGWTVQWSAVQSLTFLLLGLLALAGSSRQDSTSLRVKLALCALASPLCFSRGVLVGPALAGALLLADHTSLFKPARWLTCLCATLPSVCIGLVVATQASGNHQHLGGHFMAIARFAWEYFAGSPLHPWWLGGPMSATQGIMWAALKLCLMVTGLTLARGPLRYALWTLALFEVGNAILLGIGRYHTGLGAALSDRYQYTALLCLLPFCAFLLDWALQKICGPQLSPKMTIAVWVFISLLAAKSAYQWPAKIHEWQGWRGAPLRLALTLPPDQAPENFSRLPWLSNERTRELIKKYNLH